VERATREGGRPRARAHAKVRRGKTHETEENEASGGSAETAATGAGRRNGGSGGAALALISREWSVWSVGSKRKAAVCPPPKTLRKVETDEARESRRARASIPPSGKPYL